MSVGNAHFNRWRSRVPRPATFGVWCSLQGFVIVPPVENSVCSTPCYTQSVPLSLWIEERFVLCFIAREILWLAATGCAGVLYWSWHSWHSIFLNFFLIATQVESCHCYGRENILHCCVKRLCHRLSLPFFSSLSRCVYSPATTRTGESIHNRNFWPAFIAFCFLVWGLLCQESWLWLAGGQSVCKYLLIALDSAELFMHVVILCYSSTFNIWCIFLLSMTQQNCNQVHVPCKKESY